MPNNEVGRRSFNVPGRNYGGEGIAGKAAETMDERVARHVKMDRICRYCEASFTAEKQNQRFHSSRCGIQYNSGVIHEATFKRWERGLAELVFWFQGEEDNERSIYYNRPCDLTAFDFARRKTYLAITELRKRADMANKECALRAQRMLIDALFRLWTLPDTVDLFGPYDRNTERRAERMEQIEYEDLPVRGIDGLKLVCDVENKRWRTLFNGQNPKDMNWLDV